MVGVGTTGLKTYELRQVWYNTSRFWGRTELGKIGWQRWRRQCPDSLEEEEKGSEGRRWDHSFIHGFGYTLHVSRANQEERSKILDTSGLFDWKSRPSSLYDHQFFHYNEFAVGRSDSEWRKGVSVVSCAGQSTTWSCNTNKRHCRRVIGISQFDTPWPGS